MVISSSQLTATNLDLLATLSHITGVVALNDSSTISPDAHVPHGTGTPDAAYTIGPDYNNGIGWNTQGSGTFYKAYDFPVVLTTGPSPDPADIILLYGVGRVNRFTCVIVCCRGKHPEGTVMGTG